MNRNDYLNKFGVKSGKIIYAMLTKTHLPISIIAKASSVKYYKIYYFIKKNYKSRDTDL